MQQTVLQKATKITPLLDDKCILIALSRHHPGNAHDGRRENPDGGFDDSKYAHSCSYYFYL